MVIKEKNSIFDLVNIGIMMFVIIITLYPLIYVVSVSLSETDYVMSNQIWLLPKGFNLASYKMVFKNTFFWGAYKNTLVYTTVGTAINMAFTTVLAYVLSRRELVFRKTITMLIVFTMYFGGGLIPNFLLIKWLNMYNTIWAVTLPMAISTYNLIIMRTYMQGLPEEIFESVRIDGGNDLQIFIKIVLPLSKPVLATITLFYTVQHWNAYFQPMIYLKDKEKAPLQVILKEMVAERELSGMSEEALDVLSQTQPTSDMIIAASIIVALIPILMVYPFIQKYFVKGVMIGSLKG